MTKQTKFLKIFNIFCSTGNNSYLVTKSITFKAINLTNQPDFKWVYKFFKASVTQPCMSNFLPLYICHRHNRLSLLEWQNHGDREKDFSLARVIKHLFCFLMGRNQRTWQIIKSNCFNEFSWFPGGSILSSYDFKLNITEIQEKRCSIYNIQ